VAAETRSGSVRTARTDCRRWPLGTCPQRARRRRCRTAGKSKLHLPFAATTLAIIRLNRSRRVSCSADDRSATSGRTWRRAPQPPRTATRRPRAVRAQIEFVHRGPPSGCEAVRLQAVDEPDGSRRREAQHRMQTVERWTIQEVGQRRQRGRSGERLSSGLGGRCGDLVSDHQGKCAQNIGLSVQGSRVCALRKPSAFPRGRGACTPRRRSAHTG
jgi:hypothetical protein